MAYFYYKWQFNKALKNNNKDNIKYYLHKMGGIDTSNHLAKSIITYATNKKTFLYTLRLIPNINCVYLLNTLKSDERILYAIKLINDSESVKYLLSHCSREACIHLMMNVSKDAINNNVINQIMYSGYNKYLVPIVFKGRQMSDKFNIWNHALNFKRTISDIPENVTPEFYKKIIQNYMIWNDPLPAIENNQLIQIILGCADSAHRNIMLHKMIQKNYGTGYVNGEIFTYVLRQNLPFDICIKLSQKYLTHESYSEVLTQILTRCIKNDHISFYISYFSGGFLTVEQVELMEKDVEFANILIRDGHMFKIRNIDGIDKITMLKYIYLYHIVPETPNFTYKMFIQNKLLIISQLPKATTMWAVYDPKIICPVCLLNIDELECALMITNCGHEICNQCFSQLNSKTCGICRGYIDTILPAVLCSSE